ncbi:unnamed protein product [Colias eurytheme]|nr:unnamed protein product [Colias eurytheme]
MSGSSFVNVNKSSYYQELKRIEASTRSGASLDSVYKPKVSWFTTADGFLRTFRNKQETVSNINENSSVFSDSETQNSESLEDSNTEENSYDAVIDNNESNRIEREQNESAASQFVVPAKKAVKRRGKLIRKDDEIHEAIDRIYKIAKSVTNSTNSLIENKEDEFDIFGKYLATTLRSLPSELGIIAKIDIQKALSDIQLRALRQQDQSRLLSYRF